MKVFCIRWRGHIISDILVTSGCILLLLLIFQNDKEIVRNAGSFDNDYVISFLSENGIEVFPESAEVSFVVLDENQPFYNDYYDLQLSQGFDISEVTGKRIKKYSFEVFKMHGSKKSETFYANVYLYNAEIIAAEIVCVSLDGYMEGVISGQK